MKTKKVSLNCLRPNNWYLNIEKVNEIREIWDLGKEDELPFILTCEIDKVLAIIDGNTRAFVAWENGVKELEVQVESLDTIDEFSELYRMIHHQGPAEGVSSIEDLSQRLLHPEEYQEKWLSKCQSLINKA
ncbi:MAG: hypothetical protein ACPGJV_15910 [Bacteriovoracaceae bacterium]